MATSFVPASVRTSYCGQSPNGVTPNTSTPGGWQVRSYGFRLQYGLATLPIFTATDFFGVASCEAEASRRPPPFSDWKIGNCLHKHSPIRQTSSQAAIGGWPLAAGAQQGRVRRIGVLTGLDENDPEGKRRLSAFTQALADLGWTDGRNVRIDRVARAEIDQRVAKRKEWRFGKLGAASPVRRIVKDGRSV